MRPNILFLLPDQWRGDWWSRGGRDVAVRTPTLERIAERGTVFTSAFTPSPLCAPARACLASGQNYPAVGVPNNAHNLPLNTPSMYSALRDAGYHVAGCGKFDLHKADYSWGRDGSHLLSEWGFSAGCDNEGKMDGVTSYQKGEVGPYLSYLESRGRARDHVTDFDRRVPFGTFPTPLSDEEYCDNWITRNALDLLTEAPTDAPWFLQVNFTGPHDPFDVTEEMHGWYRTAHFDDPINPGEEPVDHLGVRRNYAAMIENIDRNVARILEHPRVKGSARETLIIFSSDHGEMLGDHGFYAKCTPHNGSLHVPLLMAGADVAAGATVSAPVSLLDVTATMLEAGGAERLPESDSLSLLPAAAGGPVPRDRVTAALSLERSAEYRWRCVIDDDFKYIAWEDGRTALYARDDYREIDDVAAVYPDAVARLRASLPKSDIPG